MPWNYRTGQLGLRSCRRRRFWPAADGSLGPARSPWATAALKGRVFCRRRKNGRQAPPLFGWWHRHHARRLFRRPARQAFSGSRGGQGRLLRRPTGLSASSAAVISLTGSNGKSTTAAMTATILKARRLPHLAGRQYRPASHSAFLQPVGSLGGCLGGQSALGTHQRLFSNAVEGCWDGGDRE